jgi:hypothetical protein
MFSLTTATFKHLFAVVRNQDYCDPFFPSIRKVDNPIFCHTTSLAERAISTFDWWNCRIPYGALSLITSAGISATMVPEHNSKNTFLNMVYKESYLSVIFHDELFSDIFLFKSCFLI